ncbi:hypothetical protein K502DRAFT_365170 [Neoconidiobolus thromboides FSU 785]|nr:hypothetical protein K502DRAFT_365170 [Neoconidiobolus thromboides FSU 785]
MIAANDSSKPKESNKLLDCSLDQVVSEMRKDRRGNSRNKRPNRNNRPRRISNSPTNNSNGRWKHDKFEQKADRRDERPKALFTRDLRKNRVPEKGFTTSELRKRASRYPSSRNADHYDTESGHQGASSQSWKRELVTYDDAEDEDYINEENDSLLVNFQAPLSPSLDKDPITIRGTSKPATVLISNMSLGACSEDIEATFSKVGQVLSVEMLYNSENKFTGNAEVCMGSLQDAKKAVAEYNNEIADGHRIQLTIKPDYSSTNNNDGYGSSEKGNRGRNRSREVSLERYGSDSNDRSNYRRDEKLLDENKRGDRRSTHPIRHHKESSKYSPYPKNSTRRR